MKVRLLSIPVTLFALVLTLTPTASAVESNESNLVLVDTENPAIRDLAAEVGEKNNYNSLNERNRIGVFHSLGVETKDSGDDLPDEFGFQLLKPLEGRNDWENLDLLGTGPDALFLMNGGRYQSLPTMLWESMADNWLYWVDQLGVSGDSKDDFRAQLNDPDGAVDKTTALYKRFEFPKEQRVLSGTLRGFRIAKVGEMPLATVAYSLVLNAGEKDGITVPAGLGWMKGKVSNKGIGTFKGLLGDGTSASVTLRLSAYGQAVLWSQPYKNKGSYIGGVVTLGNLGQTTPGAAPLEDEVWWTKAADAKTLSYPEGFDGMRVTVGTSRWSIPATATALSESLGWSDNSSVVVIIGGGGLNNEEPQVTKAALPTEFTLDDKFNLVTSAPGTTPLVVWKGKAVKTDGSFTGTLTLPAGFATDVPGGTSAASGVLVQDEPWGTVTGCGQIKVPTAGPKGSFRTASILLVQ
jgi:hypothetical protein